NRERSHGALTGNRVLASAACHPPPDLAGSVGPRRAGGRGDQLVCDLVRRHLPEGLHNFLAAYVRYAIHVGAYVLLAADPFPEFTGKPGYPVDVEIAPPQPQNR